MIKRGVNDLNFDRSKKVDFEIYTYLREGIKEQAFPEEQVLIDKIHSRVVELDEQLFGAAKTATDRFYQRAKNDDGQYDWNSISGQDCEEAIWALNACLLTASQEVTRMYNLTQFAYNIWDDAYYEAYARPIEGTQNDRTSYAKKNTKDERYYYMYLYWVYKHVKEKLDSYKQMKKDVEQDIQRRISDRNRVYE
jgi:hypothetical protein